MRTALVGLSLLVLAGGALGANAGSPCKPSEVPYLEAGCDGAERVRCWPAHVRPTPAQFCGCDGRTIQSSLPTARWRFAGTCETTIGLLYVPKSLPGYQAETLYLLGAGQRVPLRTYASCAARSSGAAVLTAARCQVDANTIDEVRVERRDGAIVTTVARLGSNAPRTVLFTVSPPSEQRIQVQPFQVLTPPPPSPAVVHFKDLAYSKIGAPPGLRHLLLDVDRAWYDVGIFARCRETSPGPRGLLSVECEEGSRKHELTLGRSGDTLIVTDAIDGQVAREVLRAPFPQGRQMQPSPLRRD